MSWIIHNEEIPEDMFVCHKCDNPSPDIMYGKTCTECCLQID